MTYTHKFAVWVGAGIFLSLALLTFSPTTSSAQEDPLSATIRAAISADGETENFTQEEIDALVEALAKEARLEGVAAGDIMWRPQETTFTGTESVPATTDSCMGSFFCMFNNVFSFSEDNFLIPYLILLSSGALVLVIGAMLHMHRVRREESMMASQAETTPPMTYGPPSSGI